MKKTSILRSLLLVLVATAVVACAIPVLASPTLYSSAYNLSGSFNNYFPGSSPISLKHDGWGDKDKDKKCGKRDKPCAMPEEPALMQMACLLALFALVIPGAAVLRRKVSS